jgi:hypothetical protein
MVLSLFGRGRGEPTVDDLVRKKQYARAVELIKGELVKRRKDRGLRLKLADVLAAAGRGEEAGGLLHGLADELALAGFGAQAIALLKRVQALQPGKAEVEEKLAYLITQQSRPAPDPWKVARREPSGAHRSVPEFGMEEIGEDAPGLEAGAFAEEPALEAELGLDLTPAATPAPSEPAAEELPSEEELRDELAGLIDDIFGPAAAPTSPPDVKVETPLFRDFSAEELAEVIRGMKLRTFEPGEILVSEGEPGRSLFVLTRGRVRAFVRDAEGRQVEVRQLEEGDFFGEAAVLTGQRRSATLTAAAECETLELDRATLDDIARRHPRVWDVLTEFHKSRQDNALENLIRGKL